MLNLYQVLVCDERFSGKGGADAPDSFAPERWLGDDTNRTGAWCGGKLNTCYVIWIAKEKVRKCCTYQEEKLCSSLAC